MAVGARQSDILKRQFLIEAILVCLIGRRCTRRLALARNLGQIIQKCGRWNLSGWPTPPPRL